MTGIHERMEGIRDELWDIFNNDWRELPNFFNAKTRGEMRATGQRIVALMDEHERLDSLAPPDGESGEHQRG